MMRSAIAFLPPCMITFMNLASSTLPYLGSGRISRLGTSRRRGIFHLFNLLQLAVPFRGPWKPSGFPLTRPTRTIPRFGSLRSNSLPGLIGHRQTTKLSGLFRALGTVLGARLLAVFHALQVERSAHD